MQGVDYASPISRADQSAGPIVNYASEINLVTNNDEALFNSSLMSNGSRGGKRPTVGSGAGVYRSTQS